MAVIEKIRQRSGLVIVIVGIALASFLVSDAINNNMGLFNGGNNTVGEIAGKTITYQDYQTKIEKLTTDVENQQGSALDESMRGMVREEVWNTYIQELVIDAEHMKLGLVVTPDELFDIVTNPVDFPQIRDAQIFQDQQTGQFNANLVINYLKQLDQDPEGEAKRQWVNFEKTNIIPSAVQKKYQALIRNGIFVTSLEVEDDYSGNYVQRDARVVGFNFINIADSLVTVTEEDMKKYLKEHPSEFRQEASRRIEYVFFDVFPSSEDSAAAMQRAEKMAESFRNTRNDTLFVENNSEKGFDTLSKARGSFPEAVEERIFSSETGEVIGPVYEAGKYTSYKVLGFENDTLSYANASQILIKPTGFTREDSLHALARASHIADLLRKGADFEQMARDSSQDYATASTGGKIGWFRKSAGRFPEAVERVVFGASKGSIQVVRSSGGAHIIRVNEAQTSRKAFVAEVSNAVEISKSTYDLTYQRAFDFAAKSRDGESFTLSAEEMGLVKRISPDLTEKETMLPSIPNAREVVRWAWSDDNEAGKVSDVIELDDQFLVAHLVSIKEKGTARLDDVRDRLEAEARKQKKAELLKERIQKAMGENKNLEQVALELGTIVSTLPNTMFSNPNLPYIGYDLRLTGILAGSSKDNLTGPFTSSTGVYLAQVTALNETPFPTDISNDRNRMIQNLVAQVNGKIFEALKEVAEVKDYRYKFF
jgi:peptidyl-prolyl cis-trans isomerase D